MGKSATINIFRSPDDGKESDPTILCEKLETTKYKIYGINYCNFIIFSHNQKRKQKIYNNL